MKAAEMKETIPDRQKEMKSSRNPTTPNFVVTQGLPLMHIVEGIEESYANARSKLDEMGDDLLSL
jgi:hypothetical protein